ncbi:CHAT domain-containing protein, partial [Streptomyces sp. OspMP-M43]|uniref:CHAT domain-containing protein n=1 Tax=Streptomyces sp. OspMP-M43 TaxID=1839781 RepID=UPI00081AFD4C
QRLAANEGRRRGRPGPPRIVLVPCGRLGAVPWHAALLPDDARGRHACQIMVITYAASGGQFLRTIRRGRRAPGAAPVLVADPRLDLTHAEREVTALYSAFYPSARLMGEFYEPPVEPAADGTPEDLLALLGEPLSLLHIASHGSAGVDPTKSALHLAFPEGTGELPPEEGGEGAVPDLGMLTVTRLLDAAPSDRRDGDGPLVVLSACETDLTRHDHDEALTLATAFVASGARDVVGSRWTTQDGTSALMMGVFHHLVAVDGLSPADALHMTQRWMLDPDRKAPPRLHPGLVREMERPGLDRPALWATFIHQGHPGPSRRPQTTGGS